MQLSLTLDTSRLANGETLQNVLQTDFSVDVFAAPTLGLGFWSNFIRS